LIWINLNWLWIDNLTFLFQVFFLVTFLLIFLQVNFFKVLSLYIFKILPFSTVSIYIAVTTHLFLCLNCASLIKIFLHMVKLGLIFTKILENIIFFAFIALKNTSNSANVMIQKYLFLLTFHASTNAVPIRGESALRNRILIVH